MPEYSEIIDRVEAVRRDRGLSKSRFSSSFGMKAQTYNNFVGAQRSKPNVHLIAGVIDHFDVNPTWLLHGQGPMYSAERRREGVAESEAETGPPPGEEPELHESIELLRGYFSRLCDTMGQVQVELHDLNKKLYALMKERSR